MLCFTSMAGFESFSPFYFLHSDRFFYGDPPVPRACEAGIHLLSPYHTSPVGVAVCPTGGLLVSGMKMEYSVSGWLLRYC